MKPLETDPDLKKTMYETILVGIDSSLPSTAALIEASNWANKHGGKLILVHAVYFDTEEFGIAPEQLDKRLKVGENMCVRTKRMLNSEFRLDAQSLLCEGEPATLIVEIAQENKADLVVLGTHGRRGLNRLLMGSVTSQVILNSPVDVLVVKKAGSEHPGEYKSILVPFDSSASSQKALDHAMHLAAINNAKLTVLYVIPRYEEMIGFFKTESIEKNLRQEAEKILDKARMLSANERGISIETEIREGHAAEKIMNIANQMNNDLIVMGSHGYRGVNKAIIGSTAERVIIYAPCPVLVAR